MTTIATTSGLYRTLDTTARERWPSYSAVRPGWVAGAALEVGAIWRSQPALRTVVSFLTRNCAQVPPHLFRRAGDGDRAREREHPVAVALRRPNPYMTGFALTQTLVGDLCLYPYAIIVKLKNADGSLELLPLPPARTAVKVDALGRLVEVRWADTNAAIPPEACMWFRPYSPDRSIDRTAPIEAVADLITEDKNASVARSQLWANGARISGWLSRPTEAPDWSGDARKRFRQDWESHWTGSSATAGGTPLLEEGMQFHRESFSPQEAEYVAGRKLTMAQVAAIFHIHPSFIGVDGEAYSSVQAYHRFLYQDTLGPWFAELEAEWQLQLLASEYPAEGDELYVEYAIQEKLEGSFVEQSTALSTAVGGPFMTRSEARSRSNLPRLDEADELIVPLNVTEGGQASPQDSLPPDTDPNPDRPDDRPGEQLSLPRAAGVKAAKASQAAAETELTRAVAKLMSDQAASLRLAKGGAKATEAQVRRQFNAPRWDRTLQALLTSAGLELAQLGAAEVTAKVGVDVTVPVDTQRAYVAEAAGNSARSINSYTLGQLIEAAADPDVDLGKAVAHIFRVATEARAPQIASTWGTATVNLGRHDGASATGMKGKTWRTTSGSPRSSHAALNGRTVPLGEAFPNGARWPGDRVLSAEERARCQCIITFTEGNP